MGVYEQRLALVTGGTGGLGAAICLRLGKLGYRVATNYRNRDKADQRVEEMKEEGVRLSVFEGDVSDFEACSAMAAEVESRLGGVDILVNNAGITRDTMFRKMEKSQWDQVIATNLDSVFNMTRPLVQGMVERGWGRVINISSINGRMGQLGQANYCAAKAGMHGFSKALALEVAGKGVTVNTISPGYIATDMVMAVREDIREKIIARIPLGRLGKPEEVAAAVAYLVSDDAGFVTGSELSINGGQHMY